MVDQLCTAKARELFGNMKSSARASLAAINEFRFADSQAILADLKTYLDSAKPAAQFDGDNYQNDLWVLARYIDLIGEYGNTWKSILEHQFSESWCLLQDSLDLLRLIKKFSNIDISFFENQLLQLERLYPYNVFFSIGATVEMFECSICGRDMDSQECPHIRGNLYGGVMACAIAKNLRDLDHVSMVLRPQDKRCVVSYEDNGEQFALVRFLAGLIADKKCRISDFGRLQFSKRPLLNPAYRKLPRNERCFCGSGKKFKNCCIAKERIEGDHVDIVAEPRRIEDAVT